MTDTGTPREIRKAIDRMCAVVFATQALMVAATYAFVKYVH